MKKLVSILLSIMMVAAVGAMSVVPAMAAVSSNITVGSGDQKFTASGAVNGQPASDEDVTIKVDENNPYDVKFNYVGKDEFVRWEIIGLDDDEYTIIKKDGTTLIIRVNPSVAAEKREFTANAITKKSSTSDTTKPSKDNTDKGSKSPSTGASVAGVAVAGAGVALLTALKKKD